MTLSKMRAETVFEFLTSNGISKDRISCIGLGYSKMIYPNARTLRKRRANMRVELTIIEYQELE
jgi:outer membrane protein OmpA-like peptidoglycan-associated protein